MIINNAGKLPSRQGHFVVKKDGWQEVKCKTHDGVKLKPL